MMRLFVGDAADPVRERECGGEVDEGEVASQSLDAILSTSSQSGTWGRSSTSSSSVTVGASRRHATQCIPSSRCITALADVLDDLEELVQAVTLTAGELDELLRSRNDRAALGGAGDGDPTTAAELEQAFLAQYP